LYKLAAAYLFEDGFELGAEPTSFFARMVNPAPTVTLDTEEKPNHSAIFPENQRLLRRQVRLVPFPQLGNLYLFDALVFLH